MSSTPTTGVIGADNAFNCAAPNDPDSGTCSMETYRHVHLENDRTITQEVTRAYSHWKIKVTI